MLLEYPPKVQEGCAVSTEPDDAKDEPDPVASPSTLEETRAFLDAQYAKSTNIRAILSSVHQMIETHSKKEGCSNEIVQAYKKFVNYVTSSKHC